VEPELTEQLDHKVRKDRKAPKELLVQQALLDRKDRKV
jgi:hypothetical protein